MWYDELYQEEMQYSRDRFEIVYHLSSYELWLYQQQAQYGSFAPDSVQTARSATNQNVMSLVVASVQQPLNNQNQQLWQDGEVMSCCGSVKMSQR